MSNIYKKTISLENEHILAVDNFKALKIGIVRSEWNEDITISLQNSAITTLHHYGFTDSQLIIKEVPGSFELALAAQYLVEISKVDAVICLGCVIQGETKHFDYVCSGITQGIMSLNLKTSCPIAFGILTTNNLEQAKERAGGKYGNKGEEAAIAVLKMLKLKSDLVAESICK